MTTKREMKENNKKIERNVYHNTSEIAQCDNCSWRGESTKEARKHCKETGHSSTCETNIVYNYKLLPLIPHDH